VCGNARRLGSFKECFNLANTCVTLLDVAVAKLKVCISNITWENGLPKCFKIKLVADPVFGGDIDLIKENICLFGILGKEAKIDGLTVNTSANDDDIVILLHVVASETTTCCN
jgi:hypothetical protein